MNRNRHEKRAFTLTELLVVIAIIAILAGLLLPALNRAKNQAAKTDDLNNFHQLMIALRAYADENQDMLTWPNWDYGRAMPDGTTRPGWLYTVNLSATGPTRFNGAASLLWPAVNQPKSYLCPMDRPDTHYLETNDGIVKQVTRPEQLSSYIMNGAVIGFRTGYRSNAIPVKALQMQAGDCVFFEGDELRAFSFNDGSSWPSEGLATRHFNGGTQATLDGAASYIRDDTWNDEVLDPNKNSLWCYPGSMNGGDPVSGHELFNH